MAGEYIPLSKKFNIDKLEFPVYVSEKLDGVPVRFVGRISGADLETLAVSRQGEIMKSVENDLEEFFDAVLPNMVEGVVYTFVWEVTHTEFKSFKDISGVVRKKTPQKGLVYNLFDYDAYLPVADPMFHASGVEFGARMAACRKLHLHSAVPSKFSAIPQYVYEDKESLQDMLDNTPIGPEQEGWVIRAHSATWAPGTRRWDYQKIVKEPMIDLLIVALEEGKGKNSGAVGRLVASYHGKRIGVGPGKLSYAERRDLWENGQDYLNKVAQIRYKPDDSYDSLREPTFQCWRHDKSEPDA